MFITEVKRIILGCTLLALFSCVKGRDFDPIENRCEVDLEANISYQQLKSLYQEETFQIQENLVIEGYIISSDEKGNFFSTLYFQDKPTKPTQGFQIEIDARDTHLFYPEGTKIFIKLKDLYLGKSKDVFKIGGVFSAFFLKMI